MLENIIELAANKVPITLKSLKNSFNVMLESNEYEGFLAFKGPIAGGWIKVNYNEKRYIIFFISYEDMGKIMRQYKDTEEVILVEIDHTNKNWITKEILYIDEDYCKK